MEIIAPTLCFKLNKDGCLRLVDAAGAILRACRGALWITQTGDAVDHILEPGGSLTLDRNGVSLVCAVTDAELRVEAAPAHRPRQAAATLGIQSLINRWVARGTSQ